MLPALLCRSCLQWKVFQADRTVLFDKIINSMGSQIEQQQDNNGCLAYWLSNTVTLLYLLQRNIKPASGGSYNSRLRASPTQRLAGDAPSCALWPTTALRFFLLLQRRRWSSLQRWRF